MKKVNPRLRNELRDSYRDVEPSPWLQTRVMASVENQKETNISFWRLFATSCVIVLMFGLMMNAQNTDRRTEVSDAGRGSVSLSLASMHVPLSPDVPESALSLSSLGRIPDMHQLDTASVSFDNPGSFCIYTNKGEKLC